MSKRVLVTGATGFVGAGLVHRLIETKKDNINIILRNSSNTWRIEDIKKDINLYQADLTDFSAIEKIVKKVKPEVIYHLAAYGTYPFQKDCEKILRINIFSTFNLLNACQKVGFDTFVNTGTSSEYGTKSKPMSEDDILEPNTCYGVSKASQTLLCQHFAREQNLPIATLRLFSVYGPYEEPTRLIPTLITSCLTGKDLNLVSPKTARDFIFIDDVIDAYLLAVQTPAISGEIFNVGSGRQATVEQVVETTLKLTQAKVKKNWGVMAGRSFDTDIWVADISKVKQRFFWQPKYNLQEGLQKTIDWFNNNKEIFQEKYVIR